MTTAEQLLKRAQFRVWRLPFPPIYLKAHDVIHAWEITGGGFSKNVTFETFNQLMYLCFAYILDRDVDNRQFRFGDLIVDSLPVGDEHQIFSFFSFLAVLVTKAVPEWFQVAKLSKEEYCPLSQISAFIKDIKPLLTIET